MEGEQTDVYVMDLRTGEVRSAGTTGGKEMLVEMMMVTKIPIKKVKMTMMMMKYAGARV